LSTGWGQPNIQADVARVAQLFQRGDHAAAAIGCEALLRADANCVPALQILGIIASMRDDLDLAAGNFQKAVRLQPANPAGHTNLGLVRQRQGRLDEAAACHEAALRLRRDYPEALTNLGLVRQAQGRMDEAERLHQEALRLRPGYPEALTNLGTVYTEWRRLPEAAELHRQALRQRPGYPQALTNLGLALHGMGWFAEALECHQAALQSQPDCAPAHNNLGHCLRALGRSEEAMESFRRAIDFAPGDAEAHFNLALALQNAGRIAEAIPLHRRAVALRSDHFEALAQVVHQSQHVCDWDRLAEDEARLIEAVRRNEATVSPFVAISTGMSAAEQLSCTRLWAARVAVPAEAAFRHPAPRSRSPLRIGYLSADYRRHAVAELIAEIFECHDRAAVEVRAYSLGADDGGAMRQRLMAAFDAFVDLRGLSHGEAARRIHEDGVDILIDLTGWTRGARTEILAFRPAPIQVNYLGYPGTMGATFVDYIIADAFVIPPGAEDGYSEAVVRLPGCYQPNDGKRPIAPDTPSRQSCGLPPDGLVFCSFNNAFKIAPPVFDVWMRLLDRVPDSVLWLLDTGPPTRDNLRSAALRRGIAGERLVFAPRTDGPQHLARHRLADLFLDTMPYNAHTTGSDALWAGVPLLTCAGATFASRVAGSLLSAVGLPELITSSIEEYEALALRLAGDRDSLQTIRAKLAALRSTAPLFDAVAKARHLEAAYRRMWELHLSGERPRAFTIVQEADGKS